MRWPKHLILWLCLMKIICCFFAANKNNTNPIFFDGKSGVNWAVGNEPECLLFFDDLICWYCDLKVALNVALWITEASQKPK